MFVCVLRRSAVIVDNSALQCAAVSIIFRGRTAVAFLPPSANSSQSMRRETTKCSPQPRPAEASNSLFVRKRSPQAAARVHPRAADVRRTHVRAMVIDIEGFGMGVHGVPPALSVGFIKLKN